MAATLAKHADRLNLRSGRIDLPPLILVTDRARVPDPMAAARRLRPGDAVLLRDYDAPDRMERAAALAALCKARRLLLIVGADVALARAVGAHGVHWPEALLRRRAACAVPERFLVTAAAHGWPGLVAARRGGADAALLSPVFPTASHPGAPGLGATRFALLATAGALPVYALGGVDAATAPRLAGSNAVGIAAIGGLAELD